MSRRVNENQVLDNDADIIEKFGFFDYNPRYKSLFLLLLRSDIYINSEDLAKALDVSARTIKSDIKLIRSELTEDVLIHSKPSKGYILKILDNNLEMTLKDYFKIYQASTINTDFETRVLFILRTFLSKKGYTLMSELQEQLNMNKSNPLSQEIKAAKMRLSEYGLVLNVRPHYGMIVSGTPFNKMMFRIRLFKLFHIGVTHAFGIKEYNNLFSVDINEKEIIRQIINVIKETRIVFSDIYLERFVVMLIYIKNISESERSEISVNITGFDYKNTDEYIMIMKLKIRLNEKLIGYEFEENIIKVLTYVSIMSTDLYRYQDCTEKNYGKLFFLAKKLRSEIIDYLSKSLNVDLYKDDILYKDLLKILIPISLKIKLEISDDVDLGYFDWEMTKSNPLIYYYINKLDSELSIFEKYKLSIREIHLIFSTILGFINRITMPVKKLKLAIISIDARLSTQQLKFNLRRHYSDNIEYIDTKMLYELNYEKNNEYDFYLTTSYGENLNIDYKPIYYADSNLSESEYVDSLHHIFYDSYDYKNILPDMNIVTLGSVAEFDAISNSISNNSNVNSLMTLGENREIDFLLDLSTKDEIFDIYYYQDTMESRNNFSKYLIIMQLDINNEAPKLKMISNIILGLSKNLNDETIDKLIKTKNLREIIK